jgi:hypothetical protein
MASRGVAEMILRTSIKEDGESRLCFKRMGSSTARNSGRRLVGITALLGGTEEREREV